jgi:hypothetical protein
MAAQQLELSPVRAKDAVGADELSPARAVETTEVLFFREGPAGGEVVAWRRAVCGQRAEPQFRPGIGTRTRESGFSTENCRDSPPGKLTAPL